jgi:hypothetical protein
LVKQHALVIVLPYPKWNSCPFALRHIECWPNEAQSHKQVSQEPFAGAKGSVSERHLIERVSVADSCDKHGLQATLSYRWPKDNQPS